jgi:DNA (cytosine-5)-methyltransferase 1
MKDGHKEILSEMMSREELSYGTVYRRTRKGVSRAELRTDGYAGCLRTPRGGSSKQILIQAGFGQWSVRLLTPREYARLQGVRDSFELPENANKGYFAMGDAVCVPVIEFLSKSVLDPIYDAFATSEQPCEIVSIAVDVNSCAEA